MIETAPAKINLFLHVTGRRADGYHELDSLVVFAEAADVLRAEPADELSLALTGRFAAALRGEPDNLVLRAARAMAASAARPPRVRLSLEKNLPVASGIGGGSADAAACLRLLGRWWGASPGTGLAGGLGADVPVCLAGRPSRMRGIGDQLTSAPSLPPGCGIALVNPGQALPTAGVFAARRGAFSAPAALPAGWPDAAAMAADLARLSNDLQAPAARLCPAIDEVLAALRSRPGSLLARMSGSGATCFALFPDTASAQRAALALQRPGWWTWGGAILG